MSASTEYRETVSNPTTGETMVITRTTRGMHGNPFEMICALPASAPGPPLHTHKGIEEEFFVLEGRLTILEGRHGKPRELTEGQSILVPTGHPHTFLNRSNKPVTFRVRVNPGAEFERFIRTWYWIGQRGDCDRNGVPRNPLDLAVALHAGDIHLTGIGGLLQRIGMPVLLLLARASGRERQLRKALPWSAGSD